MFCWQDFCGKNRILKRILQTTDELNQLAPIFKQTIGDEFAKHCKLAKITRDKLTVTIDSPVWATKFRYALPDVLKNLQIQPEFCRIREIVCRVSFNAERSDMAKLPPVLSRESKNLIAQTAKYIKNEKLKQALQRLADFTCS